ncbi:MAG: ATP-dependent DNA helicase RecG [Patescibacteria group bacterium]
MKILNLLMLTNYFRLTALQKTALARLGLVTVEDLLRHFPSRYEAAGRERLIRDLVPGETVRVTGEVTAVKIDRSFRNKLPIGEVTLNDTTGQIKAIWFHQVYLAKKVSVGNFACLRGKVAERKGKFYLANPEIERLERLPDHSESLFAGENSEGQTSLLPIYPETRGLSSAWFYHAMKKLLRLGEAQKLIDPLPQKILTRYNLPSLGTALVWIHAPRRETDAIAARKRFAFEEIFMIQLDRARRRMSYQSQIAHPIKVSPQAIEAFVARLPFPLTRAQTLAIQTVIKDLAKQQPMARLLEGDVGSGKTMVAALAAYAAVTAGNEVAYMVPTEILARQHFESFIANFAGININIGLLTGGDCRKFPSKINPNTHTEISRVQLLKWVANGEIPILIGTQTLIQKTVRWKQLGLTIIDEQHRFGVMQRKRLVGQGEKAARPAVPHLLSMTATPIPRTLALTLYGDLDLTLLDELPPGRQPVVTQIVTEKIRANIYEKIRNELKSGRQCYIICPRINAPDSPRWSFGEAGPLKALALNAKSAKVEYERLARDIFPDFRLGLLHGKLKPIDKEEVMVNFTTHKIDILVTTSVIEVGVNVPNATVIVIEGAERFGLAQLHQLRGRVARSARAAYCYLFTTDGEAGNLTRLSYLESAASGFALAEYDLTLRGAGALAGGKQWGISDIGMEAIKNLKMVEAARAEAKRLIATDPDLTHYPLLISRLATLTTRDIHFE